ncbi:MAG: immunoglobulin domain-containing protein [Limisphaerales bacterium]
MALVSFTLISAVLFGLPGTAQAQISKGHQILIDRGLQLQGLSIDNNWVTLSTYTNANYTSFFWINEYWQDTNGNVFATQSSRPEWMGPAPGTIPWGRWVKHEALMAPHITPHGGDEAPYMSQLIALQLGDEWNLNDDATRNRLVNWFIAERDNYPNTLLFHNSWGSQIADANLADFYTRAQPDMLSFDTYPWQSVWDPTQPNHTGPPISGPPTGWYGDLRRYREHGRAAGIPVGIYRQTFHAVQDYDETVFRDPSLSELRLNTFAGLAFNVKYFMDFTYNTGANSMFERPCNWCGDSVIKNNGIYAELSDVNGRAQKLGKALVRLTPITNERIQHHTTTMMFIRGKDENGNHTPVPVGFALTGTADHTSWLYQHNDPYLTSWLVTNTGTFNNGYPGDVIVSWFKPLDESFDGPNHTNQIYMMVVNGLTHHNGTPADCAQQITLNFHPTLGAIEVLNPLTGIAELQVLPLVNGLRQLVLNLPGGDGVLFKFATGAPFVGAEKAAVSGAPLITLHPRDRESVRGTDTTFTVAAAGSATLNYQWKLNGQDIPGATESTYTRNNVQFHDAGSYSVVVSNSSGSATSLAADLTVLSGVPFFYEPFDYSNVGAPVSSNNPANWTHGGSGTNDLHVAPGNLSYPGLSASIGNSITNGGIGLGVRRWIGTNASSGTLYFSVLFRMNDMGTAWTVGNMPAQIAGLAVTNNTSFRLGVMVRSNTPSTYLLGVQKGGSGVTTTMETTPRNVGDTLLLVGKYDFTVTPNPVTLWINPAPSTFGSSTPPDTGFITATTGLDFNGTNVIDRFNFRQNTAVSVPAAMQWDELRVGSSWADVTPLAPPSQTLLSNVTRLHDGSIRFSFTSGASQPGSIYASTDLVNWIVIGQPTEVEPGTFEFIDATANGQPQRFYQLRWP